MKYIFLILICFLNVIGFAQSQNPPIQPRSTANVTVLDSSLFTGKAFRPPAFRDTTQANTYKTLDSCGKIIYTFADNALWVRKCFPKRWVLVGDGVTTSYYGVDSVTVDSNTICVWKLGISQCYDLLIPSGDTTTTGVDSVIVTGDQLCVWVSGVPTCYSVTSIIINNNTIINYITNVAITNVYGSGIDSVKFDGYTICVYYPDTTNCFNLWQYIDSGYISVDSLSYIFTRNGVPSFSLPTFLKSFASGDSCISIRDSSNGITYLYFNQNCGGAGSTLTWQQTLNAPTGSTLTQNNNVDNGVYQFKITGSNSGLDSAVARINNTGTGTALLVNSSGGVGLIAKSNTTSPSAQFIADNSNTNSSTNVIFTNRTTTGTAANGIGSSIDNYIELSNGSSSLASQFATVWDNASDAAKTSHIDIIGTDNSTQKNYANFQTGGIVRVNNLADTLATKAYARSVGGGGGGVVAPSGEIIFGTDTGYTSDPNLTYDGFTGFILSNSVLNVTDGSNHTSLSPSGSVELFNGTTAHNISINPSAVNNATLYTPDIASGQTLAISVDGVFAGADGNISLGATASLFPTTGTGTATGSVTGDLDGNVLLASSGGRNLLRIDPTGSSYLESFNNTDDGNYGRFEASSDATKGQMDIYSTFNDGVKETLIRSISNSTTATITYSADSHSFTGNILPTTDNTYSLGDATHRFTSLHVMGSSIKMYGSSSGVITIGSQAAAGTYNFNLPTTAGTSGQVLTSAGGAGSAMTWTTPTTGSVTSVATGYGLSGGTITTTGTILADSATLSLKYLRRADSVGNTGYDQLWRLNKVRDSLQTNINLKANIASPTFTGTVTIPTPFTLGATSVTSTGTQLNYLNAATGTTGTTSTNLVFSTSPTLVTPTLGVASGTSLVLGGSLGASAIADFQSTTKGFLVPRMTTTQMNAISSPADGLKIYNTDEGFEFYYSTEWGWTSDAISWRRKFGTEYFNDFMSAISGDGFLLASNSSGTLTYSNLASNIPGTIVMGTSTSASASVRVYTDGSTGANIRLGGGRVVLETYVYIPTLHSATEAFNVAFGLTANTTVPTITNGILFAYDSAGTATGSAATGYWQVATGSASSRNYTTTSVHVDAGGTYKLKMVINAAASSVEFYINGTLVKTETATIPTASMGITAFINKTAGTTARSIQLDYLYFKQKFTTPR